jgi:ADP-ribose pyrophosphatase
MKKTIPKDSVLIPDQAELAFKGMIFDVYQWPQALFDGSSHTFEMLKRPDTVTAICVVEDKILVINDEQPHLGSRQSFPGGRVDETDSDILTAAQREIVEETGYSFKNWRLVKISQPYRKMEWFVYVWLAWDVAGHQAPQLDAGEKITVQSLAFNELKTLIMQKVGYLGESSTLFESLETIKQLMALPEFRGQLVER